LANLAKIGQLDLVPPAPAVIQLLLAAARQLLKESELKQDSNDTRFDCAYSAITVTADIGLLMNGYRTSAIKSERHRTAIQSLVDTLGVDAQTVRILDGLRKQRGGLNHEDDTVTNAALAECLRQSSSLLARLEAALSKPAEQQGDPTNASGPAPINHAVGIGPPRWGGTTPSDDRGRTSTPVDNSISSAGHGSSASTKLNKVVLPRKAVEVCVKEVQPTPGVKNEPLVSVNKSRAWQSDSPAPPAGPTTSKPGAPSPKSKGRDTPIRVNFRMQPTLLADLDATAVARRMSRPDLILSALHRCTQDEIWRHGERAAKQGKAAPVAPPKLVELSNVMLGLAMMLEQLTNDDDAELREQANRIYLDARVRLQNIRREMGC